MPKITFYALHLYYGGVEASIVENANLLADSFNVEIVSFYKFEKIPFALDPRVKVIYLTRQTPNREELSHSIRTGRHIIYESRKALHLLLKRKSLVKKHIVQNGADILISTRLLYHGLVANYAKPHQLKICQEHVDHKNNHRYIKSVLRATKRADILWPISKFLAHSYRKYAKIKVVHFNFPIDPIKNTYNPRSNDFVSIGRLSPEKAVDDLIRVFSIVVSKLPNAKLHIIGDGKERQKLQRLIKSFNLEASIIVHGYLSPKLIRPILKKAKMLVSCSREESFGIVFLEAFACGIPVVAFDSARGAVEIISVGGKLIKNRNLIKMADFIVGISETELSFLSKQANDLIRDCYGRKKIKNKLITFLSSELAKKQKNDSMGGING